MTILVAAVDDTRTIFKAQAVSSTDVMGRPDTRPALGEKLSGSCAQGRDFAIASLIQLAKDLNIPVVAQRNQLAVLVPRAPNHGFALVWIGDELFLADRTVVQFMGPKSPQIRARIDADAAAADIFEGWPATVSSHWARQPTPTSQPSVPTCRRWAASRSTQESSWTPTARP